MYVVYILLKKKKKYKLSTIITHSPLTTLRSKSNSHSECRVYMFSKNFTPSTIFIQHPDCVFTCKSHWVSLLRRETQILYIPLTYVEEHLCSIFSFKAYSSIRPLWYRMAYMEESF